MINLGLADHMWRKRGGLFALVDWSQMIDREQHWKIRRLK